MANSSSTATNPQLIDGIEEVLSQESYEVTPSLLYAPMTSGWTLKPTFFLATAAPIQEQSQDAHARRS